MLVHNAVFAPVENQRLTAGLVELLHLTDNDDVVAPIVLIDLAALEAGRAVLQ